MSRHLSPAALVMMALAPAPFAAQAELTQPAANQRPMLPATEVEITASILLDPTMRLPQTPLLQAIGKWLSSEFGLPPAHPPDVRFLSAEEMVSMRYTAGLSDRRSGFAKSDPLPEIIAVYSDDDETIFLPITWSGSDPAQLSVLVHEMVHHLQHRAGLEFDCMENREGPAYAAQERWLALFGTSLLAEFEIDPMTLLIRTSCFR